MSHNNRLQRTVDTASLSRRERAISLCARVALGKVGAPPLNCER